MGQIFNQKTQIGHKKLICMQTLNILYKQVIQNHTYAYYLHTQWMNWPYTLLAINGSPSGFKV